MSSAYTDITFTNAPQGGITATKLNLLRDDLSTAIAASGGGGTGTGDMTKAVYDTTNNAKVDHAELSDSVPWTGVTGKPSTFPPDSTAMLKSVYDTDNNGVTDHSALADSVPWTGITGKPSTFPPDPHQASHVTGSDQIPSASITVRGLMPVANNVANNFYASDATQKQVTYAMLGGAQPAPTAHAPTHKSGGTDAIKLDELAATTDVLTLNSTTSAHGLLPKLGGGTVNFLRADGTWVAPPTGGVPSAHASTHITGGTDIIPVATTSATGLSPIRSGTATTYLDGSGSYSTPAGLAPTVGFITKTAAYTLTTADSGKYVICSNGAWTLTLPAPAAGLYYRVRNDMGISGTIGTITVAVTGGTIDGAASIALLPQQECTIITDGTNWRTHGLLREVVLGVQVTSSSTASGSILLPAGYRYFELVMEQIVGDTDGVALLGQFSINGGSTWIADGNYREGNIWDNAATTMAYAYGSPGVGLTLVNASGPTTPTSPAHSHVIIYPGNASVAASWLIHSAGWHTSAARLRSYVTMGYHGVVGLKNALKWSTSAGNITNMVLVVKGVV